MTAIFHQDSELPGLAGDWYDRSGTLVDFSTGYTLSVQICAAADENVILDTKSTSITGAATSPNFAFVWDEGELATLSADANGTDYLAVCCATRTSDGLEREPMVIPFKLFPARAAAS